MFYILISLLLFIILQLKYKSKFCIKVELAKMKKFYQMIKVNNIKINKDK